MKLRPAIFLSGVSSEFASFRDAAEIEIQKKDCFPLNQPSFVEAIRDGVNHCYFAIADTTDDRPNVMYELGLAHALGKPVILLRRMNPDGSLPSPPFDFQTQNILGYDDNLDDLRRRLETAIGVLTGRIGQPLTT